MSFTNPGRLYIEKCGSIQALEEVLAFAEFLRIEAGVDGNIPVDLNLIFGHFEIPEPKIVPLNNLEGLLVDSRYGIIIINSEDPQHRQKFTKAHELVEFLFLELPQGTNLGSGWISKRPGGFKEYIKEYLCNRTAGNLLMPVGYIESKIQSLGVNFKCASAVSKDCDVSFSAALVQLAHISPQEHFVVLWRMKNKPTEIRNAHSPKQLPLLPAFANNIPAKKLRVEWSLGGGNKLFVPKNKSVENSSLIYQAWESKTITRGRERLTFDNRNSAWYYSENIPFHNNDEWHVLSLILKE